MKDSGYMDSEVLGCQFSIYPLRQSDVGPAIREAIESARDEGCEVRVGNLSTLIVGGEDEVFRALRAAYRAAQRHGSAVMTATFAAGMPSDELVAEIQEGVNSAGETAPFSSTDACAGAAKGSLRV